MSSYSRNTDLPAGCFVPEITQPRETRDTDYLFVFKNREVLVNRHGKDLRIPKRRELGGIVDTLKLHYFIGTLGDDLCFAGGIEGDRVPDAFVFEPLRTVYLDSGELWRPAISTAVLVVDWDLNHRFCGRCGEKTVVSHNEWCRRCSSCGHSAFPRTSPAVIVAVLKKGKILLAHNRRFAQAIYSLIAGFVEPGEFLEDAVRREVMEEAGLLVRNIRYFGSQSWPFPDSLMVGFIAEYQSGTITLNEELEDARWFDSGAMPEIPTHGSISRKIIDWYLETGGDGALPEGRAPQARSH